MIKNKKASPLAVGIFVLLALAIIVFASFTFISKKDKTNLQFDNSDAPLGIYPEEEQARFYIFSAAQTAYDSLPREIDSNSFNPAFREKFISEFEKYRTNGVFAGGLKYVDYKNAEVYDKDSKIYLKVQFNRFYSPEEIKKYNVEEYHTNFVFEFEKSF